MSTIDTLPDGWTWEGPDTIRRPGCPAARITWSSEETRIDVGGVSSVVLRSGRQWSVHRLRVIDTAVQLLLGYRA